MNTTYPDRTKNAYLLFPKTIKGKTKWLVNATWRQSWSNHEIFHGDMAWPRADYSDWSGAYVDKEWVE